MALERIDKILSSQLNISRKDIKLSIKKGRAKVNDVVINDPSLLFDPEKDLIFFDGQAVEYQKYIYILMNKPKGVLSASTDKKRETVVSLVPKELNRNGLFPVGRLDKDTTGLIIITDDGDFAHRVLSPKAHIYKTYIAELDGDITSEMIEKFSNGITLADESECRTAFLKRISENKAEIKICEGKYHQIKRMFGVVNLGVNELCRVGVGGLDLPINLKEGECVQLTKSDIKLIFNDIL